MSYEPFDYEAAVPSDARIVHQKIELAFGATWNQDPAEMTWTDVTGRCAWAGVDHANQVHWARGRASGGSLDRTPQPGTLALTLDSLDGYLIPDNEDSPYYPNVQPGLMVRHSVEDSTSIWRPQFYGIVTSITAHSVVDGIPDWSQVDITATDLWAQLMQAGERRSLRDFILLDLAGSRSLSYILISGAEYAKGSTYPSGSAADEGGAVSVGAYGVSFFKTSDVAESTPGYPQTGGVDWDTPGAAGVIGETGRTDFCPGSAANDAGVAYAWAGYSSDRYGGALAILPGADQLLQGPCTNGMRMQITLGRPPVNLLPAATTDPTNTSGWTGGAVTLQDAASLSWTPKERIWDPVTATLGPVKVSGPAKAVSTSGTRVSLPFPVTVGKKYAPWWGSKGGTFNVAIRWFDSGGATISTTASLGSVIGAGAVTPDQLVTPATAPSGAVTASLVTTGTTVHHGMCVYEAEDQVGHGTTYPQRWWAPGASADLRLFAQAPLQAQAVLDAGASLTSWLMAEAVGPLVEPLADGEVHAVVWNLSGDPSGQPKLWPLGKPVDPSDVVWRVVDPGLMLLPSNTGFGWDAGRNATVVVDPGPPAHFVRISPLQPSTILNQLSVFGANAALAVPDDDMAALWADSYGSPAVFDVREAVLGVGDPATYLWNFLDEVGWPRSLRNIDGVSTTPATLPSPASPFPAPDATSVTGTGEPGDPPAGMQDSAELGDYGSLVSGLVQQEFGWPYVDGAGVLQWLPRRWYDPDGDGLAVASLWMHWRDDVTGALTYDATLARSMSEDGVTNDITVQNIDWATGATRGHAVDLDSVRRLGRRPETLTNLAWSGDVAAVSDIAEEIIALYGRAVLVPASVTFTITDPNDANLTALLELDQSNVVLVTIPAGTPADPSKEMDLGCIVTQVAWSADGITTTCTVSLMPCPIPVRQPYQWAIDPFDDARLVAPLDQPTDTDTDVLLVDPTDNNGQVSIDGGDSDRILIDV